ncbi:hypothetical protein V8D89_004693 [Ganoderma adspersum]
MAAREPREVLVNGSVIIKHPDVDKPLFRFPAFSQPDPTDPSQTIFGVCRRLVLDACRVITNHASDNQADFLAEDREGQTPVHIDDPKPLSPGTYFYFLGPPHHPANRNYPIVKSFSAFVFPSQIPDHWYSARSTFQAAARGLEVVSSTEMSAHVSARDKYCILSGWIHFNHCAHLVPEAEWAWFEANDMTLYTVENEGAGVNAHTNGVLLRDDVKRCFDSAFFVFYPTGDSDRFMAYFVHPGGYPDYTEQFHRRLVSIDDSVPVEFIYARFAYTVINLGRCSALFDSIEVNDVVKKVMDQKTSANAAKEPKLSNGEGNENSDMDSDIETSFASDSENPSIRSPPQESYADGDERWKHRLFGRIPEMAALEDVEDPPETVACHTETPHMLRLRSSYIRENPQVWQTSRTPEGATRDDTEGWYAAWMPRPL